ncbi:MAG TPA: hypothetical protein VGZ31_06165 [Chthoniobacterales bacterium]|nr:hypothetical protein [Chthoniobacterales bacterium]
MWKEILHFDVQEVQKNVAGGGIECDRYTASYYAGPVWAIVGKIQLLEVGRVILDEVGSGISNVEEAHEITGKVEGSGAAIEKDLVDRKTWREVVVRRRSRTSVKMQKVIGRRGHRGP